MYMKALETPSLRKTLAPPLRDLLVRRLCTEVMPEQHLDSLNQMSNLALCLRDAPAFLRSGDSDERDRNIALWPRPRLVTEHVLSLNGRDVKAQRVFMVRQKAEPCVLSARGTAGHVVRTTRSPPAVASFHVPTQ